MNQTVIKQLLTVNDVTAMLGIGRTKVWQMSRDGRLKTVKIDKSVRFKLQDVEAFIASLESK